VNFLKQLSMKYGKKQRAKC